MKTILRTYRFNLEVPAERKGWEDLQAKLEQEIGVEKCMEAYYAGAGGIGRGNGGSPYPSGTEVELCTTHLFDNQWNDNQHRLYDWFLMAVGNRHIKTGYYLEQTEAMRRIRRETVKCGYCGHMEKAALNNTFCTECLDSQFLSKDDLPLLRLLPIGAPQDRSKFTAEEEAKLLPKYTEAQTVAKSARLEARWQHQLEKISDKYQTQVINAQTEHDGMLWLWERNVNLELVLYYDHTQKFGFGWQRPVEKAVAERLRKTLSDFPFEYEIKEVP